MEHSDILSQVECELDLAFGALRAGDSQALEQQATVVMAHSQDLLRDPGVLLLPRERLQQVAVKVQSLRAAVLRHATMTDQALQMLVPATQSHTYGSGAAGAGISPYGSVARASGRMEAVFTA